MGVIEVNDGRYYTVNKCINGKSTKIQFLVDLEKLSLKKNNYTTHDHQQPHSLLNQADYILSLQSFSFLHCYYYWSVVCDNGKKKRNSCQLWFLIYCKKKRDSTSQCVVSPNTQQLCVTIILIVKIMQI